ncbi:MAG: twin transmembrane helix small protein [Rhodomicrobium sp.]
METFSKALILAALFAVGAVLALGLGNMMRGGSSNRSQKLMRWRVALQFIAILVILTSLYFASY